MQYSKQRESHRYTYEQIKQATRQLRVWQRSQFELIALPASQSVHDEEGNKHAASAWHHVGPCVKPGVGLEILECGIPAGL